MFYPEDSLKRGGRFYLCWVADSWPLRFATITHRQLWSQDIRRICEDLLEVMTNESGRPTQRFSLRLSSQLLRGLVRLYQRKVNVLLGDLCMINSYVIKHANKKWNAHEVRPAKQVRRPQPMIVQEVIPEPPETEQRIEEMIRASGNAVANIQDITLREPQEVTDNLLLKPNDGFGEEADEATLLALQERSVEFMLQHAGGAGGAGTSGAEVTARSALGATLDVSDAPHDKSRRLTRANMEGLSEHDLTMFAKSMAAEELMPQLDKDIPEIPEILPIELPVPPPEKSHEEPIPVEPTVVAVEPPKEPEPVEIELEELEEEPQTRRRRIRNRLIIDKKIKISAQYFRARIENPNVELRCEDSFDDIISIIVPPELYFHRPSHGGHKIVSHIGFEITRLFSRNLGVVNVQPRAERESEEVMQRHTRNASRTALERIEEEQDVPVPQERPQAMLEQTTANVTDMLNITDVPRVSVPEQMEVDIADMLTQKVETISQARKRKADSEAGTSPKKQRRLSSVSFRDSRLAKSASSQAADLEADKENRPANLPQMVPREIVQELEQNTEIEVPARTENAEQIVSSMLQEAGLADIQIHPPIAEETFVQTQRVSRSKSARGTRSDSSETPLGSLDRTKVSLGDSEQTTDSKRFIRDQWGTEGTMLKILKLVKTGRQPVNVNSLIAKGPIIPGYKRIIAARCFTSILKLKQHGFICVNKDPETLEISNINLGSKLRSSQD